MLLNQWYKLNLNPWMHNPTEMLLKGIVAVHLQYLEKLNTKVREKTLVSIEIDRFRDFVIS